MDYTPYRELLEKMKTEAQASDTDIATSLQSERAADELDIASADSQAALSNRLLERQSSYVRRIEVALKKIEDGTYGECEDCGQMISPKRLLARPVAVLCVLCKERQERAEKKEKGIGRGFLSAPE